MRLKPIHHNHSVCCIAYHFVTVNYRRRKELPDELVDMVREAVAKYPIKIIEGNVGERDHLHLVIQSDNTLSPAQVAKIIKGCTYPIMRKANPSWSGWSRGYYMGAGDNALDELINYVQNQEKE